LFEVVAFAERSTRLKRQFLELLERDKEFRLAVAGYLGLSETLTRLESVERSIEGLLEEMKKLREDQQRLWEEVRALREGQNKLWENTNKLWENVNKLWEEVRALREGQNRLWEEVRAMRGEMRDMNVRLGRVERTLEKLTLEIEEEARIVVKHRLREMGYEVDVTSLILPEVEVNVYGVSGDLCVVGEARVRASSNVIDEIDEKIEALKRLHPDRLRPRVLRVVYATLALPDLVARAEREGIWVLRAVGDVVKPKL
jgi:chromosome segregation ATPase